jgi:hypothetical protein
VGSRRGRKQYSFTVPIEWSRESEQEELSVEVIQRDQPDFRIPDRWRPKTTLDSDEQDVRN